MAVRFPSKTERSSSSGGTRIGGGSQSAPNDTPLLLASERPNIRRRLKYRRVLLQLAKSYLHHCYTARTAARVTEFASFALVDRSHLTQAFVRLVGTPPLDVMRDLQVVRALGLLRSTEMTNEEIANRAAFGTRNTFQRVFATRMGMSPAEYRYCHKMILDGQIFRRYVTHSHPK